MSLNPADPSLLSSADSAWCRQHIPQRLHHYLLPSDNHRLFYLPEAAVACVNIAPKLRRAEIQHLEGIKADHLLEDVVAFLKAEGYEYATLLYDINAESAAAVKNALTLRSWSPPLPFLMRCHFDCHAFDAPWYQKKYNQPKGFKVISLSRLTDWERKLIENWYDQGRIHQSVYPFRAPERIQYINSVALRMNGELAGWMVTHTFPETPDTVNYSSFYIDSAYQSLGHAVFMLIEAIRLQQKSSLRWASLEVNYLTAEQPWLNFINKRLINYALTVERIHSTTLKIK